MIYRKVPTWAAVACFALVAVFVAGFFHESESREAAPGASAVACKPSAPRDRGMCERAALGANADGREAPALEKVMGQNLALHVPANLYRRAGEFSSKVDSVIKAYQDIDKRMKNFGGEITEMEITGNDEGRQGRISCTVSSDKFNDCIDYVRSLGKVLSERITATSKPAPRTGVGRQIPGDDDPDPREISLVSIQIMDEKVAREVHESRGMLAGSFNRSASHFMAGIAVIVELLGWVAPYVFILAVAIAPFAVARLLRRRERTAVPLGAEHVR